MNRGSAMWIPDSPSPTDRLYKVKSVLAGLDALKVAHIFAHPWSMTGGEKS